MIATIEDLRVLAKKRVPRMFYEYVDAGSWSESTYRANSDDFAALNFRQRVAVDISQRSLETTMLGQRVSMPVALAPTGLAGMQRADGEILAARAAERFGVPFALSTVSICSIEDVAEHTSQPFWFQLYVLKDREYMKRLIARARGAQCSALILTLDLQIQGRRHKDHKNGLSAPPRVTARNLLDFLARPRWCMDMLRTPRRTFGNIVGHVDGVHDLSSVARWTNEQFDPTLSWADVARIKDLWGGKLIVKGILDAEDADLAVRHGADALVVSNHGGRQLDGAPSSIRALPGVVAQVGERIEVYLDGGVRSGQDVVKALALGARGVHVGRAPLYGLGALGETGVLKCLDIIREELDLTMAFCGVTDVGRLNRTHLAEPGR